MRCACRAEAGPAGASAVVPLSVTHDTTSSVQLDYLTLRITSLMCAIDATYQGGMGRAVGGIFTADGDTERVFRCVVLAFLRHYDVLLLSFCRSLYLHT